MKKLIVVVVAFAAVVLSSEAALRRLPAVTVTEGASVEFSAETAVNLKSSNTSLVTVLPPDGGRSTLSGVRIGTAEIVFSDVKGQFAVMPVNVVPMYWDTLTHFFEDDPEILISVSGDKVIISGQTANPETLSRVNQASKFDAARILTQVTYSTSQIALLVKNYISQVGYSNVTVGCIGRNVCIKGKLYDQKSIELVTKRAQEFLKPFEGIGLNTDGLKVIKQRIVLEAEFLEYSVAKARNLGIKWPSQITAEGKINYGWNWSRGRTTDPGSQEMSATGVKTENVALDNALTESSMQTLNSDVSLNGLNMTINMLKHNDAAKSLYKTTLATQSGEEVEFQNGGTLTIKLEGTFSGGQTKDIEYGFLVRALPVIIDETTVSLALALDNKTKPEGGDLSAGAYNLQRYQTKSRYVVRPGETIVMSGFNAASQSQGKDGMVFLSHIPLIGEWLFGSRSTGESKTEMLLVVTVNWALDDESGDAIKARDEMKNRSAEVEMP